MTYQPSTTTKYFSALFGSLLLVSLAGCQSMTAQDVKQPEKQASQPIKKQDCEVSKSKSKIDDLVIIGAVERVALPEQNISLNARIDTGATTTSINAQDIKPFERDGKKWVRFDIHNESQKLVTLEKPISRVVNIKRHGAEDQDRYAVKVRLKLGEISLLTEVTLADRAKFTYPLLIGRNFLQDMAIVDVSKEHTAK